MSIHTRARTEQPTPLSQRTLEALAHFGMPTSSGAPARPDFNQPARELLASSGHHRGASITLICGPSGAGKSSLLLTLESLARAQHIRVIRSPDMLTPPSRRTWRVLDLFSPITSTQGALATLARFGLGDATLLTRTPRELSDGQRARLALALAFDSASRTPSRHTLITSDEFTSGLDRPSAQALCTTLHRMASASMARISIVLATAHDDVEQWLGAATRCAIGLDHRTTISRPASAAPRQIALHISPGTYADYASLSHLHYRAGRPACLASGSRAILVARRSHIPEPIGVLVMAMPTLNARWRALAWPGRFSAGDKARDARRLNDQLRCIARVIVDPRFRGAGVARRLVHAYLERPLTSCTEAIAAMGAACPFFQRAGMTPIRMPPAARHARLLDALDALAIQPTELLDHQRRASLLRDNPALHGELARWARSSRAGRRWRDDRPGAIEAASRVVASEQVAYVHERR